ncbi:MAG: GldG family protein, partial [bacterium]|nr:GldG family protein [bacterium]
MNRPIQLQGYTKFLLYLAVVVLINLAAATLFFRADLTSNRIYSLSPASKEVVATLSEPLTIKVFFTSNLPAPYNNIERYLHDLLQEYAIAGNRYFNYQFYNVSGEVDDKADENQQLARNYGIPTVQVQNIEQDEVKFQMAQMGMALIHGDLIETIPTITSTEGLEFQITSTIRRMNNKISALLALKDPVTVNLILSSSLQMVGPYMNLAGLPELPGKIEKVVAKLNEKNYGRLTFSHLDPSSDQDLEANIQGLPVLPLRWNAFTDRQGNNIPGDKGYAGIVLHHGGKTESIPLINVVRLPLFGTQYVLTELEKLETAISEG